MSIPAPSDPVDAAAGLIARLTEAHRTLAVAESLTGGALLAALVAVPGASAVLRGGVVAYDTALKHSLLGVDADLLAEHGPVHPEVALAMARGVRATAAVDGAPADLGLSTTGVAGPDPQGSAPVGLVFIAVADARGEVVRELRLLGDRAAIRVQTVAAALALAADRASASRE
ncbi:CinA family protein [Microcella daejeonensis]|uniref:CinA family protein n=1 Tax=Microcella daejeonensis TaxID=2994971 RepID=A0A9E8MM54_9MICO|nr:CinA family protein [Microcella daejeonensis]WAB81527.1 CinA family protein [Microcella daejeonensis]